MEKTMKKHRLVVLSLIIILIGIIFLNIHQHKEIISFRNITSTLYEEQTILKNKNEELFDQNNRLEEQVKHSSESLKEMKKKYENSGIRSDLKSEYIDIVNKLFDANLNFTPKTIKNKKKEVSKYLTDELDKVYFGQNRKTYQDVNGTYSKLKSIEIYLKEPQEKEIEGLVVICFVSKQGQGEWSKKSSIFKVYYDSESKKIADIINLGTVYSI